MRERVSSMLFPVAKSSGLSCSSRVKIFTPITTFPSSLYRFGAGSPPHHLVHRATLGRTNLDNDDFDGARRVAGCVAPLVILGVV
jgi:hypothetical protein